MSTRRIGSFLNLSPLQELSINPFSELNSDSINKLTKSISNGKDGVVFGLDVINPNWNNESIQHYNIFKSGDTTQDANWSYDRNYCTVKKENNKVVGFKIQDITKCTTQTITYKIRLEDLNIEDLNDLNIEAKFNISFHIVSGCPKKVYAYVNNCNSYIEYPNNGPDEVITIPVTYNFLDIEEESISGVKVPFIKVSLLFVMDPTDTYTKHTIRESNYNVQSLVEINNLTYEFDIVNLKDIQYRIKDNNLNGDYPSQYIHPTHTLEITGGIAIKDDVVVDIKGKNKKFVPALKLDLNSETSWICNNPYTISDFTHNESNAAQQRGFIYNNIEPLELNLGSINESTKDLEFIYNGCIFKPSDEYVLTDNDFPLSVDFTQVTNHRITVYGQDITNMPECYGSIGYIYNKITNKIIKKIELDYTKTTNNNVTTGHVAEKTFELDEKDLKINWRDVSNDTIGFVLSAGPVKVSGHKKEYCPTMVHWGYVVLYYTYLKNPRPNKAYIGIIRDSNLNDLRYNEDYVILAKIRFISPNTVDLISYENRQQIFQGVEKAIHISYGQDLTPEETSLWIDPQGVENIPSSVSDAITKLIKWIPLWIDKYSRTEKSVRENAYNLFVNNQIVKWIWNSELDRGDLKSTGYYINPEDQSTPFTIAAWNSLKNTIIDTPFTIDPGSISKPFSFTVWNNDLNKLMSRTIDGINGQIYFYDSDDLIKADWIMTNGYPQTINNDNIYICNTDEDVEKCKSITEIFDERVVYDTWIRFGHTANNQWNDKQYTGTDESRKISPPYQYGIDSDYPTSKDTIYYNSDGTINWDSFTKTDVNHVSLYGTDFWYYDSLNEMVLQPVNCYDYTGFVSNQLYYDYDITLHFDSPKAAITTKFPNGLIKEVGPSGDNDAISFVAGFTTDSNNRQHTISFVRSGGDPTGLYWSLTLDKSNHNTTSNLNSTFNFITINANNLTNGNYVEDNSNWQKDTTYGAYVHVKRTGNIFTATTSNRKDPNHELVETSKIVLNLNNIDSTDINKPILEYYDYVSGESVYTKKTLQQLISDTTKLNQVKNTLKLFINSDGSQKGLSWGYGSCSQPYTTFKNISVRASKRKIIDINNNKILSYNFDTESWNEDDLTKNILNTYYQPGKFTFNKETNKFYWYDGTDIIEIKPFDDIEYDINELTERVSNLEEKTLDNLDGINGQVLFKNNSKEKFKAEYDWIMNNGYVNTKSNDNIYVCNTLKDIDECKLAEGSVSQEAIFKKWIKFGHHATTNKNFYDGIYDGIESRKISPPYQYGIDSDYPNGQKTYNDKNISGKSYDVLTADNEPNWTDFPIIHNQYKNVDTFGSSFWFYDKQNNIILQPINSWDYTGFVSDNIIYNYDITIYVSSLKETKAIYLPNSNTPVDLDPSSDNDTLSFVAGFITDTNGRQHTISFVRANGDGVPHWGIIIDKTSDNQPQSSNYPPDNTCNSSFNLLKINGVRFNENRNIIWNQSNCYGAYIKVTRNGNKFTAYTSSRIDPNHELLESSKIILDLDNIESGPLVTYYDYYDDNINIISKSLSELINEYHPDSSGTSTITGLTPEEKLLQVQNTLKLFVNNDGTQKGLHWGYATQSQAMSIFQNIKVDVFTRKIVDLVNNKVLEYNFTTEKWDESTDTVNDIFEPGKFTYNSVTNKLFWNNGNEIVELLPNVKNKVDGGVGEVLYATGTKDVTYHAIMDDTQYLCLTENQVAKCKEGSLNYDYIFSKWIKWGFYKNKQYGIDEDYTGNGPSSWVWDNTNQRIEQTVNSSDLNGFVCNKKVNNLNLISRFLSTSSDDDHNGLCLMVYDNNGRQHVLVFQRCLAVLRSHSFTKVTDKDKKHYTHQCDAADGSAFRCWYAGSISPSRILEKSIILLGEFTKTNVIIKAPRTYDPDKPDYTYSDASGIGGTIEDGKAESIYVNNIGEKSCPVFYHKLEQKYCAPSGTKYFWDTDSEGNLTTSTNNAYTTYFDLTNTTTTPSDDTNKYNAAGWEAFPGGVVMQLQYTKNDAVTGHTIIKCRTSKFMTTESNYSFESDYDMELDIDSMLEDPQYSNIYEMLKLFKNGVHFGFCNHSQAGSYFKIITLDCDLYSLIDVPDNKIWKYINNNWVDTGLKTKNYLLPGTQYYNSKLDIMYWSDEYKQITQLTNNKNSQVEALEAAYPPGSIYIGTQETCPFEGVFGTWQKVSQGRCLWGADNSNTNLNTNIEAGLPKPTVQWVYSGSGGGLEATIHGGASSGATKETTTVSIKQDAIYGKSTTVQPPAFVVNMWQRTE